MDGFYHLNDRQRFAAASPSIPRGKPIEAQIRVIRASLFWEQQDQSVAIGGVAPGGSTIVGVGGLRATMEDHNQGRSALGGRGNVDLGLELARVRAKVQHLAESASLRRGSGRPHLILHSLKLFDNGTPI